MTVNIFYYVYNVLDLRLFCRLSYFNHSITVGMPINASSSKVPSRVKAGIWYSSDYLPQYASYAIKFFLGSFKLVTVRSLRFSFRSCFYKL